MRELLFIGLGGFLGAIARFVTAAWCQRTFLSDPAGFPLGTLVVNVLGCLLLGFLTPLFLERTNLAPEIRLAVAVGFLGSFTTFSTFGYETFALINEGGAWGRAGLNVGLSVVLGLAAVILGYRLEQHFLG